MYQRQITSKKEKMTRLENVVVVREVQNSNGDEEFEENQDELKKLYVST